MATRRKPIKISHLDGRKATWTPKESKRDRCSSGHLRAREFLHKRFPAERVLEEVVIPHSGGLRLDFLVIARKIAVEVQGEQHESFNSFFHTHMTNYLRSRMRDEKKRDWCRLNGITLIELPDRETDDEWQARIRNV